MKEILWNRPEGDAPDALGPDGLVEPGVDPDVLGPHLLLRELLDLLHRPGEERGEGDGGGGRGGGGVGDGG